MEFVITRGTLNLVPIPAPPEAGGDEVRAGYLLNITDEDTGIIFRVSMGHDHAAKLGAVMVEDTDRFPAAEPKPTVEAFQAIPGGLTPPGDG